MDNTVDVIMPVYNEEDTLEMTLESIAEQTVTPGTVWVAEGGSTDHSLEILESWKDRLPIQILKNDQQRQAPGLNQCFKESQAPYVARLDGHTAWTPGYLETLMRALEEDESLGAVGALVDLHPGANQFQKNVWAFMCHVLGTGGPSYRVKPDEPATVPSVQSPVYRRDAVDEVGRFREDLPWAEDDELHFRLRNRGWDLLLHPGERLYYLPRSKYSGFFRQMNHYGRGRGQLGRRGIYPSRRHKMIDRLLMIWTFGLVWNPIGWGFALFYSFFLIVIVAQQWSEDNGGYPLFLLFPGGQISYWLGWLATRFNPRTELSPTTSEGGE